MERIRGENSNNSPNNSIDDDGNGDNSVNGYWRG